MHLLYDYVRNIDFVVSIIICLCICVIFIHHMSWAYRIYTYWQKKRYSKILSCIACGSQTRAAKAYHGQNLESSLGVISICRFCLPDASSTMRALSSARCTDVRLYTLRIKIGTNQRALGELSHYWTRLRYVGEYTVVPTKSDSDVIVCLQLLSNAPLDLTRIDRTHMYINPFYRLYALKYFGNKTWHHCHSWLTGQYMYIF